MSRFDHLEMGDWRPVSSVDEPDKAGIIGQEFYLEKAHHAFNEENYERALSYYSRALQYDINLEDAWLGQLRCLIDLRELQEAIIWSERALERFPKSSQILAARAVAESRLGRTPSAMGFLDSAFAPGNCTAYVWAARGEILIPANIGNARACFTKALELAPADWTVRSWIARAYIIRGMHHQALEHLRVAVRLEPESFTCWYWIGKCHQALGEFEEAERAYNRSLAAQPAFTRAIKALEELSARGMLSKIVNRVRRILRRN